MLGSWVRGLDARPAGTWAWMFVGTQRYMVNSGCPDG